MIKFPVVRQLCNYVLGIHSIQYFQIFTNLFCCATPNSNLWFTAFPLTNCPYSEVLDLKSISFLVGIQWSQWTYGEIEGRNTDLGEKARRRMFWPVVWWGMTKPNKWRRNDRRASCPARNTSLNHLKCRSDTVGTAIWEEAAMHGTNSGISRVWYSSIHLQVPIDWVSRT